MSVFPTLSIAPTYPYSVQNENDGIVSDPNMGTQHARRRYSPVRRRIHSVAYKELTNADRLLFQAHINEHGIHNYFNGQTHSELTL